MTDIGTDPVDPEKSDDPASPVPSEIEPASASAASESGSGSTPPPLQAAQSAPAAEPATESSAPLSKEEKNWAAAVHGAGAVGLLCHFTSIPFLNIIIPLIIWIIKKDEMPFVRSQGKEVLNFQISWTIYGFAAALVIGVIGFILTFVVIGIFILWALAILAGIYVVVMAAMSVIGTLNAADGKPYKYPATIQFIK